MLSSIIRRHPILTRTHRYGSQNRLFSLIATAQRSTSSPISVATASTTFPRFTRVSSEPLQKNNNNNNNNAIVIPLRYKSFITDDDNNHTPSDDFRQHDDANTDSNIPNPNHPLDGPFRFLVSLLEDYQSETVSTGKEHVTTARCNTVIENLGNSKKFGSIERANFLFSQMEQIAISKPNDPSAPKPDISTYNAMMDMYYQTQQNHLIPPLFQRLLQNHQNSLEPTPNPRSFVLLHLSNTSENGKAERDLYRLKDNFTTHKLNVIMWHYSRTDQAARAEELLEYMGEMVNLGYMEVLPTTKTFNMVIHAWAKSNQTDAGERAHQLLDLMEEIVDTTPTSTLQPDTYSYNSVIHAFTKCGNPERATELLQKLLHLSNDSPYLQPNKFSYTCVIQAWAEVGDGPKAQALLDEMERLYDEQVEGNTKAELKPDFVVYNAVLLAWINIPRQHQTTNRDVNVTEQCYALFQRLLEQLENGNDDLQPDVFTYRLLLRGITKDANNESLQRAEALMQLIEEKVSNQTLNIGPDQIAYNALLFAIYNCCPDDDTIPFRSEVLFQKMERIQSTCPEFVLDSFSYKMPIMTWLKSNHPDKLFKANAILMQQEDLVSSLQETNQDNRHLIPERQCYIELITECANAKSTESRSQYLEMALQRQKKYVEYGHPIDHRYYEAMIRLSTLMENHPKRNQYIASMFQKARGDGMVNYYVLQELRRQSPLKLVKKLLWDDGDWQYENVPAEWKRNVPEKRQRK